MLVVEIDGVTKRIKRREVLKGVSMHVEEGSIYVLAGPNGAGKTTTIRVLLGLIKRDSGSVRILGVDPQSSAWEDTKRFIGYLPEDASPYDRLTGSENLRFYAMLYADGDPKIAEEYYKRGVLISGLSMNDLSKRAGAYSKGMKRRLLIASALMHEPKLVIMDEPTSGLDVFASYSIKKFIKESSRKGYTFIITTHDMKEAEELATHVGFISDGKLVFEGTVNDALEKYNAENLEEAFIKAVGYESS